MNVTFSHGEDVARDTRTFWFKPERPVRYIAGQFTEIHLPHDNPDDRGIRRWFTLSSSPTEDLVGITTKFAPEQSSSFKNDLFSLAPGASLNLADPMGDFVLPKDPSIPLVFAAAGLGITPVRSMIKWLQDTGEKRSVHLIYAVRNEDELAFTPLFRHHDMRFTPIVKTPSARYTGQTGSISVERILQLAPDDGAYRLYLSGPEKMVEDFYKTLRRGNFSEDRLVTDYFPGYPQL